jgi:hypothetical protein
MPREAVAEVESQGDADSEDGEDLAPTPSALMSLIPVGEAILRPSR